MHFIPKSHTKGQEGRKNTHTAMIVSILTLFLLLLPFVLSAPKTPQIIGTITILNLKNDYMMSNTSILLHFHAFDANYSLVKNDTTTCYLNVYNYSDQHISTGKVGFLDDDFIYQLPSNVSDNYGVYPYVIWCNGTKGNGATSDTFEINIDARNKDNGLFLGGLIIFLPLVFAFLIMYWVSTLGEDHNIIKLFLSLLAVSLFFASLWFATLAVIKFTLWLPMINALSIVTFVFGLMFFIILGYFIVYLVRKVILSIQDNKEERLEY